MRLWPQLPAPPYSPLPNRPFCSLMLHECVHPSLSVLLSSYTHTHTSFNICVVFNIFYVFNTLFYLFIFIWPHPDTMFAATVCLQHTSRCVSVCVRQWTMKHLCILYVCCCTFLIIRFCFCKKQLKKWLWSFHTDTHTHTQASIFKIHVWIELN